MTLLTRFEKFYNRFYFTFEYFVKVSTEGIYYLQDYIARTIDRFHPNAHVHFIILNNRNNTRTQNVLRTIHIVALYNLRFAMVGIWTLPIWLVFHFILNVISQCVNNEHILWKGCVIALFISFFLALLIDYFCSFRHNKYERYREEYLKESTSKKVMWVIFYPIFILSFFIVYIWLFAFLTDHIPEYILPFFK